MVVMWSNDLMFKSKVRASAEGRPVEFVGTVDQLTQRLGTGDVTRVLVDMDVNTPDLLADLSRVVSAAGGAELVIFGSHMRMDIMSAARDAGFHKALARSAFVKNLPEYLA